MTDSAGRRANRARWPLIVFAAALGIVLFAMTAIAQGACYDSPDPAASYCTYGSPIPAAIAPYVWVGYAGLAAFLVYRAVRRGPRR